MASIFDKTNILGSDIELEPLVVFGGGGKKSKKNKRGGAIILGMADNTTGDSTELFRKKRRNHKRSNKRSNRKRSNSKRSNSHKKRLNLKGGAVVLGFADNTTGDSTEMFRKKKSHKRTYRKKRR